MSDLEPDDISDVVSAVDALAAQVEALVYEQRTANLIAFTALASKTGKTADYRAAMPQVRDRLNIPTDRNPR